MSASGFVYVLENESMPGIVKVGMTTRLPEARASELWTTGVPTPFTIAFSIFCDSPTECELDVHQELSFCRVNDSREFFCIETKRAVVLVANYVLRNEFGMCVADEDWNISDELMDNVATACGLRDLWMVGQAMRFFTKQEWMAAISRSVAHRNQCVEIQNIVQSVEADHG